MVIAELPPIATTATEPQTINFDTVLEPTTELVASVVWTVPAGLTIGTGVYAPTLSPDLRKSTLWLTPPMVAGHHLINAHITTTSSPPREDDYQLGITVV